MYTMTEKIYYSLAATILGAAFFVAQPTHTPEVAAFQSSIQHQFKVAIAQLWGDEPVFTKVVYVVDGVIEFYQRSADQMMVLLTPAKSEDAMFAVLGTTYHDLKTAFSKLPAPQSEVAGVSVNKNQADDFVVPADFMQKPPVANLRPQNMVKHKATLQKQMVSAAVETTLNARAVNDMGNPWVNLRDNDTGQVYCVAIYNAEVNRYLGPCKNDIH